MGAHTLPFRGKTRFQLVVLKSGSPVVNGGLRVEGLRFWGVPVVAAGGAVVVKLALADATRAVPGVGVWVRGRAQGEVKTGGSKGEVTRGRRVRCACAEPQSHECNTQRTVPCPCKGALHLFWFHKAQTPTLPRSTRPASRRLMQGKAL